MTTTRVNNLSRTIACVLGLIVLDQTRGQQDIKWREFKSEKGGFSVLFPADPEISEEPFEKGPLILKRHIHAAALREGVGLDVEYFDMPPGSSAPELAREGGMNAFTRPMIEKGAKLLTRGPVVRETCEGLEATLSLPAASNKTGFAQARVFTSGLRYYLLFFLSDSDNSAAIRNIAEKFIESFSVTGGCTSAVPPVEAPTDEPTVETVQGTVDKATGWRRFDRRELGFSVLMPGTARHETRQAQKEPIPLMHQLFLSEDEERVFSAEVIGDYPPKFYDTTSSLDHLLELTIWGFQKNVQKEGFVITVVRELRLTEFPGRELALNHKQLGLVGRAQVYATPKRAFVFTAITSNKDTPSVDRFFSSILISPK